MLKSLSVDALNQSLIEEDWPRIDRVFKSGTEIELAIHIRADLSYLTGHFPEQPVVPGVVQVHWVGQLAQELFDCRGFSKLKKVKFNQAILPENSLTLKLDYHKESAFCRFEYHDTIQSYSSGVLGFAGVPHVEEKGAKENG